jgi:hypothetical protein
VTEKSDGPAPSAPHLQVSICLELLDDIQEQLRFADQKAGFVSVLNVFLFGFIATHFDKLRTLCESQKVPTTAATVLALVLVAIYLLFTVAALLLVVSCVMSRFGERGPESRVFFGHIARRYAADPVRYAQVVSRMTDAEWVQQLGQQVAEVSRLAIIKHKRIRWATICTLVSVFLWMVALVTMVAISWARP